MPSLTDTATRSPTVGALGECLLWENNGFVLYYKSLVEDKFRWPKPDEGVMTLTGEQINLMRDEQLSGFLIQADETRIQVLKELGKTPQSNRYMWVTRGGPPDKPSVLFDYNPSRGKEVPLRLFEGYSGYLQADGYASYEAVCEAEGITLLGCWDHYLESFFIWSWQRQPA